MIDVTPKFWNFVAQTAHFATTYCVAFTAKYFFGWQGYGIAAGGVIAYAAIHEYWYDPRYETLDCRGNDTEDFLFLVGGACLAALVSLI